MENLTESARRVFAGDRFATEQAGIEIAAVEEHCAQCTLAVQHCHRNARGAVMGGALFTLADFAAAVAANTGCLQQGCALEWVSLDATIHYLSPATGDTLMADCRAVKHGRTTALYQTTICDSGRVVAQVHTTMIHVTH